MSQYLTVDCYRNMGFGADISDIDDGALTMQLRLASNLANRFCNRPTDFDFRGGTVTDEQHIWHIGNEMVQGTMMIFPKHRPLVSLSAFRIYVTNTQYLNVDASYLHYNERNNTLTPVIASTAIGVWSYSAIPIAGFVEPEARITYIYGQTITETGEALFQDDSGNYRAANQWWTDDDVTIYLNGTALDESHYTVNRDEGIIIIDDDTATALSTDGVLTADYMHKLPADIRDAVGVITTDLIGSASIVGAGLLGLSGIRAEEIELRQATNTRITAGEISDRAKALLMPYREFHWG